MKRNTNVLLENVITIYQSENGVEVPGTRLVTKNVTEDAFYINLFRHIRVGGQLLYLDDLYDSVSNATGLDMIMAIEDDSPTYTEHKLDTAYNSGGDGSSDTDVEYYGEKLFATETTLIQLRLIKDESDAAEIIFGYRNINYTVAANRRLHIYYKLSKPSGTVVTAASALSS